MDDDLYSGFGAGEDQQTGSGAHGPGAGDDETAQAFHTGDGDDAAYDDEYDPWWDDDDDWDWDVGESPSGQAAASGVSGNNSRHSNDGNGNSNQNNRSSASNRQHDNDDGVSRDGGRHDNRGGDRSDKSVRWRSGAVPQPPEFDGDVEVNPYCFRHYKRALQRWCHIVREFLPVNEQALRALGQLKGAAALEMEEVDDERYDNEAGIDRLLADLEKTFGEKEIFRRGGVIREYETLTRVQGESITAFLRRFRLIERKLQDAQVAPYPDESRAIKLLDGLRLDEKTTTGLTLTGLARPGTVTSSSSTTTSYYKRGGGRGQGRARGSTARSKIWHTHEGDYAEQIEQQGEAWETAAEEEYYEDAAEDAYADHDGKTNNFNKGNNKGTNKGGMTQRQLRFANSQCLGCGSTKHYLKDCPNVTSYQAHLASALAPGAMDETGDFQVWITDVFQTWMTGASAEGDNTVDADGDVDMPEVVRTTTASSTVPEDEAEADPGVPFAHGNEAGNRHLQAGLFWPGLTAPMAYKAPPVALVGAVAKAANPFSKAASATAAAAFSKASAMTGPPVRASAASAASDAPMVSSTARGSADVEADNEDDETEFELESLGSEPRHPPSTARPAAYPSEVHSRSRSVSSVSNQAAENPELTAAQLVWPPPSDNDTTTSEDQPRAAMLPFLPRPMFADEEERQLYEDDELEFWRRRRRGRKVPTGGTDFLPVHEDGWVAEAPTGIEDQRANILPYGFRADDVFATDYQYVDMLHDLSFRRVIRDFDPAVQPQQGQVSLRNVKGHWVCPCSSIGWPFDPDTDYELSQPTAAELNMQYNRPPDREHSPTDAS
eukprot:s4346_g5.t1